MHWKDIFGPPEKRPCEARDLHAGLVWLTWLVDCLFNAELTALLSLQKLSFVDTVNVILSLTINEALKWFSSLPILKLESFWWWRYSVSSSPPPLPPTPCPLPPGISEQYLFRHNSALNQSNQPASPISLAGTDPSVMFVVTNILSWRNCVCRDKSFVATKIFCRSKHVFFSQQAYFCRNKRRVLSRQTHVCRNKTFSWQKWYFWQLTPMTHKGSSIEDA